MFTHIHPVGQYDQYKLWDTFYNTVTAESLPLVNIHLIVTVIHEDILVYTFSNAGMGLRNIILITTAGFTLSYARYGKLRNGYDVMQLHARI